MKNKFISTTVYLLYGLLIAVGPQTLFKVCTSEASMMKCYWTARAELGIGGLFVILALLSVFTGDRLSRIGLSLFGIAAGILAIAFPLFLIGGCGNLRMPCRTTAFPVIYLITGLLLIYLAINLYYLIGKQNKVKGEKKIEEK